MSNLDPCVQSTRRSNVSFDANAPITPKWPCNRVIFEGIVRNRSMALPMLIKMRALAVIASLAIASNFGCSRSTGEGEAHAETADETARAALENVPPATADGGAVDTASVTASKKPQAESKLRYVAVRLEGALEQALAAELGETVGVPLSQVTMRALVWWVDVRKDLRRGDRLEIIFEPRETEEPVVHAVWLQSEKLGRIVSAVRYKAEGESFARWYLENGEELELRMVDSPIEGYEQVTSLLNDGRGHKGVDFKAPVGTPIKAPFDGVVVKKNWGGRNGNCLWLQDPRTGKEAKLLHLDRIAKGIGAGTRVKRGQQIATSGNTGRSTAPHLHYQLEKNGRVIDPFRTHGTWRAKLKAGEAEKAKKALHGYAAMRMGSS